MVRKVIHGIVFTDPAPDQAINANMGGNNWIEPTADQVAAFQTEYATWQNLSSISGVQPPLRLRISLQYLLKDAQSLAQVQARLSGHMMNGLAAQAGAAGGCCIITLETMPAYLGPDPGGWTTDLVGWKALVQTIYAHYLALGANPWIEWRNEPDILGSSNQPNHMTVAQVMEGWRETYLAVKALNPAAMIGGMAMSQEGAPGTAVDPSGCAPEIYFMRYWLKWARDNGCSPSFLTHHAYGIDPASGVIAQAAGIPAYFRQWALDAGYSQAEVDAMPIILDEWNRMVGSSDNIGPFGAAFAARTIMALKIWQIHQALFNMGNPGYCAGWLSKGGFLYPKAMILKLWAAMQGGAGRVATVDATNASIMATWRSQDQIWAIMLATEGTGSQPFEITLPVPLNAGAYYRADVGTLATYNQVAGIFGDEWSQLFKTGAAWRAGAQAINDKYWNRVLHSLTPITPADMKLSGSISGPGVALIIAQ